MGSNEHAVHLIFFVILCVLFTEMLHGWWRVSDINQVHCLVEALHSRGIREKVLHRQIQKHMEFVTQIYDSSRKDGGGSSSFFSLLMIH